MFQYCYVHLSVALLLHAVQFCKGRAAAVYAVSGSLCADSYLALITLDWACADFLRLDNHVPTLSAARQAHKLGVQTSGKWQAVADSPRHPLVAMLFNGGGAKPSESSLAPHYHRSLPVGVVL